MSNPTLSPVYDESKAIRNKKERRKGNGLPVSGCQFGEVNFSNLNSLYVKFVKNSSFDLNLDRYRFFRLY